MSDQPDCRARARPAVRTRTGRRRGGERGPPADGRAPTRGAEYLKEHALKKPMGVLHIWALGVGVVITGEYFGWNQGLKEAARSACCWPPCSCARCTRCGCWPQRVVLAMPFAGGPLAYGRRAVGPAFRVRHGLVHAPGVAVRHDRHRHRHRRLHLLRSQLLFDGLNKELATTAAGLVTVAAFAGVQWVGSKRQAQLMGVDDVRGDRSRWSGSGSRASRGPPGADPHDPAS